MLEKAKLDLLTVHNYVQYINEDDCIFVKTNDLKRYGQQYKVRHTMSLFEIQNMCVDMLTYVVQQKQVEMNAQLHRATMEHLDKIERGLL